MRQRLPRIIRNPVVVVGIVIVFVTGISSVAIETSVTNLLLQSFIPITLGVAFLIFALSRDTEDIVGESRIVLKWTALGLAGFLLVGGWFGQISERPNAPILLSMVASLSIGLAFGTLVGIYAARLHGTNERLKEANRQLKRKNDKLDEFVDVASHDLRNPVTVAQGHLELAKQSEGGDHVESAEEALERMDVLINDLVELAKEGSDVRSVEPVNLRELSEGCWESVATDDTTLEVATDRTIQADENRLRQLLENLFRNTVEHTGSDVTVTVGDLPDGFFVADTGTGLPAELYGTITADEFSVSQSHIGLGLSIVARIVEAHGWRLTITESKKGGARFEFTGVSVVDAPRSEATAGTDVSSD